jgi:hypothetical protein
MDGDACSEVRARKSTVVGSQVNKAECVSALLDGEHGRRVLGGASSGMRTWVTALDVFWVNKRRTVTSRSWILTTRMRSRRVCLGVCT